MRVPEALDALLARLQPRTPVDAGLAESGVMIDDPLEALVLRALAAHGPLSLTDLAAFVAASPRPARTESGLRAIKGAGRRLRKRGLVIDADDHRLRLSTALDSGFGAFPRLSGRDRLPTLGPPPAIDLRAAIADLPPPPGPGALDPAPFAALGIDPAALAARRAALPDGARALLDWLGDRPLRAPWRASLDHGMKRLGALVGAALSTPLPPWRGFEASWLVFVEATAEVLPVTVIAPSPTRREELVRRWAWFVDCPIAAPDGVEPTFVSAAALTRLDHRRVVADARALDVMRRAEAAAEEVLGAERKRRAEAAKAYASGRRE